MLPADDRGRRGSRTPANHRRRRRGTNRPLHRRPKQRTLARRMVRSTLSPRRRRGPQPHEPRSGTVLPRSGTVRICRRQCAV